MSYGVNSIQIHKKLRLDTGNSFSEVQMVVSSSEVDIKYALTYVMPKGVLS